MILPTPLRRSRICGTARSRRFGDVRVFGIVTSTNAVAARLAATGAAPGLVVIAQGQTEGRGRRGRPWISPPGSGLFASVVIPTPPPGQISLLAGAAGVAAAGAIRSIARVSAGIKWPNDLWVDERKVGGVLVEIPGRDAYAIVGIGITLVTPAGVETAPGAAPVAGVAELIGREVLREALAASLLDHLEEALALAAESPDELRRRYRDLDVLSGREILAETPEGVIAGRVAGVDLGDGIDLVAADRTRKRLRPEHTHVLSVLPRGEGPGLKGLTPG